MTEDLAQVLDRAHSLGEERDWEGASEVLSEALDDFSDDVHLLCALGVARRELGDWSAAYELFKQVLALQPEDAYVLATAGAAVAHYDDPEAEPALRTAAMLAPELALARVMYGAYLAREGFLEEGLAELRAAAALDDEDPVIPYELGAAYALSAEYEKARMAIARSVELDPVDGWVRVVLGLVELETDDLDEAVTDLAAGADERPEDVEAQLLAALALGAAGWEDRAYGMLERARERALPGDRDTLTLVEEKIEEGADASGDCLRSTLGPAALRERLMARP